MLGEEAQAKRRITADDLFRITLVGDPHASSDGSMIAWVQTVLDKPSDTYRSAIWAARGDGSSARQLTSGAHRDASPRWSPDGSVIAFSSNRPAILPQEPTTKPEGTADKQSPAKKDTASGQEKPKTQLWTIRVDGGEADQLTNHPNGIGDYDWSPASDAIVFTARDDIAESDDFEAPLTNGGIADERIVHDIHYRADGQGFIERVAHLWQVQIADKSTRQLTTGDAHDSSPQWSPDGRSIAFLSNRSPERRREWNRSAVHLLDVSTGAVTAMTPEDASFGSPCWSPAGDRLAFLGHLDAVAGSKNTNLWTVRPNGSDLTNHSRDWDISIGDFGMSDVHANSSGTLCWLDGARLLGLVSERGETQIYRFELESEGCSRHKLTNGAQRITGFAIAGDRLAMVRGQISAPFELFGCHLDGTNLVPITKANDPLLAEVELSPAMEIEATAPDGQPVQAWLLRPDGFADGSQARHPLILQIHGGPHAMYGHAMFHEMQLMAARGYAVLFSNPRGSAGYGEHFTSCTRGHWGESDMPDVIAAVEAALELGWIDVDRLGVTGGSYGGYLTNWIIGHDDRFRAAVTQRCVSNFHSFFGTSDIGGTFGQFEFDGVPWSDADKLLKHSPISYVDRIDTPLLIIHNEHDFRCPIEQAEQMYTALKYLGKDVGFVRIPEESHDLSRSGTPSRRLARLHHLIGWFDAHI